MCVLGKRGKGIWIKRAVYIRRVLFKTIYTRAAAFGFYTINFRKCTVNSNTFGRLAVRAPAYIAVHTRACVCVCAHRTESSALYLCKSLPQPAIAFLRVLWHLPSRFQIRFYSFQRLVLQHLKYKISNHYVRKVFFHVNTFTNHRASQWIRN